MSIIICKKCNKKVEVRPYRINTAKFCSNACKASVQWTGVKRPTFGAEYRRKIGESSKGHHRGLGRKVSKATRKIISIKNKGKVAWNKGLLGFRAGEKRVYNITRISTKKIERICVMCKKSFDTFSYYNRRFCSRNCVYKDRDYMKLTMA